jgi:hypothetical protein
VISFQASVGVATVSGGAKENGIVVVAVEAGVAEASESYLARG